MPSIIRGVLSLAIVVAAPLEGQSSWCQYRRGTLGAIIDEHSAGLKPNLPVGSRNDILSADTRPTRAEVLYLGESRALPQSDSSFLDGYLFRVVPDSAVRPLFHRQIRVVEGTDTLWLATQDSLLPALATEVPRGSRVTLFVRWLGARQEGPATTWEFAVNEFASPVSQAAWDRVFRECQP